MKLLALDSPLGTLRVYGDANGVAGVYLPDQRIPAGVTGDPGETPILARAAEQLAQYFAGTRRAFDLPLSPSGTAFQRLVWEALSTIPYGSTWTYQELARAIGKPSAMRAVGAANGKNPLSIIVPCHRVIGAGGALTGYAGGLAAKQRLLAHEASVGATKMGSFHADC
jgi:methylated-DNA-[protein]-cysteine S-methyltransferase